ncbi:Zn-dependent hydrolase [Candidatus Woesearchaeota archaeon CG10_big_fil_rev_8_21_14_0_10_34_12]|nr:MAG: Zn-dependent hydrolase [Candidatus Woesearchaeota archaeon CG10_big_fil_rev_8_21_14_0_10_34_12]
MEINNVEIKWLGHSSVLIKNSAVIYIDPYNISSEKKADIILITHDHYDHCSIEDIKKIIKKGTIIITVPNCQSKITRLDDVVLELVEPGDEIKAGDIKIDIVPAYNIEKEFHPKGDGVGYVIKIDNVIIYHAGDTDVIPEMEKLTGYGKEENEFVALLPVSGNFTMNVDQAVMAAEIIKPGVAIPIHYGSLSGTIEDAENFIKFCKEKGINAELLTKE